MARYLTCLDAIPAPDGSCELARYTEQPSPWPTMTVEQGKKIGQEWMFALVAILIIKHFLKPSTHKRV